MKKMQRLDEIQKKLSFVFGKKPIVYFVTEDVDFIDELYAYDIDFKSVDTVNGEKKEINKAERIKQHYNSSSCSAWKNLIDEDGEITYIQYVSGEYYYIKNFNYLYGMNNKKNEKSFYTVLMKYVTFFNKLNSEQKKKTFSC